MNEIKTHDTMSPESQRIAIAEACGWVMRKNESDWLAPDGMVYQNWGGFTSCPDNLNDLNACHEFEKAIIALGPPALDTYEDFLLAICTRAGNRIFRATATQRCEAFLKTIGKWRAENDA